MSKTKLTLAWKNGFKLDVPIEQWINFVGPDMDKAPCILFLDFSLNFFYFFWNFFRYLSTKFRKEIEMHLNITKFRLYYYDDDGQVIM